MQTFVQELTNLPNEPQALIVKFSLTDINIRRDYEKLTMCQIGAAEAVDLTHYFYLGPYPVPGFGSTVEVIVPWDKQGEPILAIAATLSEPCSQMEGYSFGPSNSVSMPSGQQHNPYAYASFQVVGFMYK